MTTRLAPGLAPRSELDARRSPRVGRDSELAFERVRRSTRERMVPVDPQLRPMAYQAESLAQPYGRTTEEFFRRAPVATGRLSLGDLRVDDDLGADDELVSDLPIAPISRARIWRWRIVRVLGVLLALAAIAATVVLLRNGQARREVLDWVTLGHADATVGVANALRSTVRAVLNR
jgi:uncharacterized membrane protein YcjF (UPF0283 family)